MLTTQFNTNAHCAGAAAAGVPSTRVGRHVRHASERIQLSSQTALAASDSVPATAALIGSMSIAASDNRFAVMIAVSFISLPFAHIVEPYYKLKCSTNEHCG